MLGLIHSGGLYVINIDREYLRLATVEARCPVEGDSAPLLIFDTKTSWSIGLPCNPNNQK